MLANSGMLPGCNLLNPFFLLQPVYRAFINTDFFPDRIYEYIVCDNDINVIVELNDTNYLLDMNTTKAIYNSYLLISNCFVFFNVCFKPCLLMFELSKKGN